MPTHTRVRRPSAHDLWWIAVVAWMAVIFRLSAIPGSQVPGRFGSLGHFLGYAVLGVLVFLALKPGRSPMAVFALTVLFCSLYGITDEFHQSFVPSRSPDIADWGVDTIGAAFGAAAALLIARGVARRRPL